MDLSVTQRGSKILSLLLPGGVALDEPVILSEPLCSHLSKGEDALNTCLAVWL